MVFVMDTLGVGFEVLTPVFLKMQVFYDLMQ